MQFKDPTQMMPSEMVPYIRALHSEIEGQAQEVLNLKKPDTFVLGQDVTFMDKKTMLENIQVGQVREATTFRSIAKEWIVKISDTRIDSFDTRIEAEGVAMLHNVG